MQTFKQFLSEERKIVKLSAAKAAKWLIKEYKEYSNIENLLSKPKIYRGRSNRTPYELVDSTNAANRMSANTAQWYTYVIANSPEWKAYPRRDHICSTNCNATNDYGVSFIVIPKNGAKVGVCDAFDIWSSKNIELHKQSESLDSINGEMTNVIDQIRTMLKMNTNESLLYVKDLDQFGKLVEKIDEELAKAGVDKIVSAIDKDGHIRNIGRKILISLRKHGSIKEMLFAVYSPKSLGTTIETFPINIHENREVWVDGEVLFIRYIDEYERNNAIIDKDEEADKDYVVDLLKEVKKQLEKF